MILDDDQNILDALGANFRSMGYEVETQSNPLRALEQLKIRHYDNPSAGLYYESYLWG